MPNESLIIMREKLAELLFTICIEDYEAWDSYSSSEIQELYKKGWDNIGRNYQDDYREFADRVMETVEGVKDELHGAREYDEGHRGLVRPPEKVHRQPG